MRRAVLVPPVVVPAALALLLALLGRLPAAVLALVVALLLSQGFALSPRFRIRFHRVVAAVAATVGHVLAVVLLAPVFFLVFVPARLVSLLWGAATGRRASQGRGAWEGRPGVVRATSPARPFELRPLPERGWLLPLVGLVAMVLVVDLAGGAALGVAGVLPGPNASERALQEASYAAMVETPALQDEPWAPQWGDDMVELFTEGPTDYEPFLGWGHPTYSSEHVNLADGERRSYESDLSPGDGEALRIGFFGGSTMFGFAQRDEHTIPSEVARLAEAEGIAVEVHNHGLWGWNAWQEALYLEQLLALGADYDLVVFYDGVNEVGQQYAGLSPDPTHGAAAVVEPALRRYAAETRSPATWTEGVSALVDEYRRHSATVRLVDELRRAEKDPLTGFDLPTAPPDQDQIEANAADVYARSVALARGFADRHAVPALFFWQPQRSGWSDSLRAALPAETIDVSDALDGTEQPIYVDGAHHNELGAAMVAEAMWPSIVAELDRG